MSQYYEFFCPVKILAGLQALDHLSFELARLNVTRVLLVTDRGIKATGLLALIDESLKDSNITIGYEYSDTPPDSSFNTVTQVASLYAQHQCDGMIAVGGGSVIDTAKAVNILVSEQQDDLTVFAGAHKLKHPLKPFIMIPTTAGTGSEVTSVAVISDDRASAATGQTTPAKVSFVSYYLLPNVAILDPRMTRSLPPLITAMTAMDAMTHAIEAYISLAHNPLSDAYATAAIEKISQNLIAVLDESTNTTTRLELAQASTMAGIAFSNAMVGLVHSLGHATGAVAHLPHGVCMNIFLPYVLSYHLKANNHQLTARIGQLLLPLAGADCYAATPAAARSQAAIDYLMTLRDTLHQRTGLARRLSETNKVEPKALEIIAELALDDGSIVYSPVEADHDDLLNILRQAF